MAGLAAARRVSLIRCATGAGKLRTRRLRPSRRTGEQRDQLAMFQMTKLHPRPQSTPGQHN